MSHNQEAATRRPPETASAEARNLATLIRDIPDFPQPGVIFKDLTPLFADAKGLRVLIDEMAHPHHGQVDVVAAIEARGFILGAAVAYRLGVGFVPIRKAGKLPSATIRADYQLEYGQASVEIHSDALTFGQRVLLVDDVLATGGTAVAACHLIQSNGAQVVGIEVAIDIAELGGRARLTAWPFRAVIG